MLGADAPLQLERGGDLSVLGGEVAREDREALDLLEAREIAIDIVDNLLHLRLDAVNAERSRFEQLKRFVILPRDFTMEDGELTPTLKLKRRVCKEHFADELEELYAGETLNQAAAL